MEILTGEQMRRVDARTIEGRGIRGLTLMENAGRGVASALFEEIPRLAQRRVVIVCGKGNNGGDGLAAARRLARLGVSPLVLLVARSAGLRGDARTCLTRARSAGVAIQEVEDASAWSRARASIDRECVVLDALLGTGASGGARGAIARVIEDLNRSGATVAALDVPSGIDADTGHVPGPAVLAHRTYTLCRPKVGLVVEPGASHAGTLRVIDIGIPDEDVAAERAELEWLDAAAAARLLPPRPPTAHKGMMGHLLVVAGSHGKSGAAILVAGAALRAGVGLVTVATSRSALALVAAGYAEAMTEPLAETSRGAVSAAAEAAALRLVAARSALALGPGLGAEPGTRAFIRSLVRRARVPCVLDADGLNAFATPRRTALRAGRTPLVLTPHPGEASRLLGVGTKEIGADRLGAARRLAARTGATVVLKGRYSIVADPSGRAAVNASGNPGMATAGSGDALTGVIGALLARELPGFDAARLGTYLHGDAGDRAAGRLGEDGMIAGDLVFELPAAWKGLRARRQGGERWTRGG
jgi:NAD(P)H-hydrate epimerase